MKTSHKASKFPIITFVVKFKWLQKSKEKIHTYKIHFSTPRDGSWV